MAPYDASLVEHIAARVECLLRRGTGRGLPGGRGGGWRESGSACRARGRTRARHPLGCTTETRSHVHHSYHRPLNLAASAPDCPHRRAGAAARSDPGWHLGNGACGTSVRLLASAQVLVSPTGGFVAGGGGGLSALHTGGPMTKLRFVGGTFSRQHAPKRSGFSFPIPYPSGTHVF